MRPRELIDKAAAEAPMLSGFCTTINLDLTMLLAVAGALQLAMRHPQFKNRPSSKLIRSVIDKLIEAIPPEAEYTRILAKLDDNPKFDV